jgi:hypothetical protein
MLEIAYTLLTSICDPQAHLYHKTCGNLKLAQKIKLFGLKAQIK